uniref:Interferon-induced protein with tetratricopeptide repeats 1-like n=1 Tax=Labrus bergylta TaxID=56723 RepID=A0A3Q3F868_9LABR|nr:interferon-induced protein with tetratricopeptide repeats 1-like isoform X1 [Labrus bergylta]XP_020493156.1 interferon-induced protein with tetratricopeptide repeats 1-like isoform X2 [Labrus bergylta]XP_020493157.1 interferon-induced protein with tetratricopeptide repeats 1-like isoform X3 [Labrus bergylta]
MSAAQSQTTLESLQCHFTWDLDRSRPELLRLTHKMEDFSTEEGNKWLGHIYNLWGFIQYKLGLNEEAKSLFQKAAETLNKLRDADEGPWLVVNYGNLAWLHHHLGDLVESQAYLSKIDALMEKYPSPSQDELHPEIYAEKAWTLIYFGKDRKLVVDYYEKAARMQPDMVEWNTGYVLALVDDHEHNHNTNLDPDLLEKMRQAKEQDPENLYLAVLYLEQLANKRGPIKDEVCELVGNVSTLWCSGSGMWALLNLYIKYITVDDAIDLAEKVLKEHPDVRYLKKCVALCYRWKIIYKSRNCPDDTVDRAIALHEELLSLYPHAALKKETDLASIYAKSSHSKAKAEQIFQKLLDNEPAEPADKQMLYNIYANHLYFNREDHHRSVQYHMKAAAIPEKSYFHDNSMRILKNLGKFRGNNYVQAKENNN